jgi:hypothetical protein
MIFPSLWDVSTVMIPKTTNMTSVVILVSPLFSHNLVAIIVESLNHPLAIDNDMFFRAIHVWKIDRASAISASIMRIHTSIRRPSTFKVLAVLLLPTTFSSPFRFPEKGKIYFPIDFKCGIEAPEVQLKTNGDLRSVETLA